jgi:hypothetical protein
MSQNKRPSARFGAAPALAALIALLLTNFVMASDATGTWNIKLPSNVLPGESKNTKLILLANTGEQSSGQIVFENAEGRQEVIALSSVTINNNKLEFTFETARRGGKVTSRLQANVTRSKLQGKIETSLPAGQQTFSEWSADIESRDPYPVPPVTPQPNPAPRPQRPPPEKK